MCVYRVPIQIIILCMNSNNTKNYCMCMSVNLYIHWYTVLCVYRIQIQYYVRVCRTYKITITFCIIEIFTANANDYCIYTRSWSLCVYSIQIQLIIVCVQGANINDYLVK